jgi:DNA-binding MarR family transcriptional regulator
MSRRTNGPPNAGSRGYDWPEPPPHTAAGKVLTDLVIATFRLNGRLLEIAQNLAARGAITAAWWQVLGGILDQPRTVPDIARTMGMTRQGVQRVADLLVERELAEYRPNPAHRRAKLLACTDAGYAAIRQIAVAQHPWANQTGAKIGTDQLQDALTTMQRLIVVLEAELAVHNNLATEETRIQTSAATRRPPRERAAAAPTRRQDSRSEC